MDSRHICRIQSPGEGESRFIWHHVTCPISEPGVLNFDTQAPAGELHFRWCCNTSVAQHRWSHAGCELYNTVHRLRHCRRAWYSWLSKQHLQWIWSLRLHCKQIKVGLCSPSNFEEDKTHFERGRDLPMILCMLQWGLRKLFEGHWQPTERGKVTHMLKQMITTIGWASHFDPG